MPVHIQAINEKEVETELVIAFRLEFIDKSKYNKLLENLDDISRMLTGLSNHLKKKIQSREARES